MQNKSSNRPLALGVNLGGNKMSQKRVLMLAHESWQCEKEIGVPMTVPRARGQGLHDD